MLLEVSVKHNPENKGPLYYCNVRIALSDNWLGISHLLFGHEIGPQQRNIMKKEYQRLAGKGRKKRNIFGFTRLYLGKDHLLCVYNSAYTEDYRRFYFRDIQSIVIGINSTRERLSACFTGAALLLLLFAFWRGGYWAVFFMILACLFLLNALINWRRGPTCTCQLSTAASHEELPSLGRLQNAMKVIEVLKPLILECQGTLSHEDIRTKASASKHRSSHLL